MPWCLEKAILSNLWHSPLSAHCLLPEFVPCLCASLKRGWMLPETGWNLPHNDRSASGEVQARWCAEQDWSPALLSYAEKHALHFTCHEVNYFILKITTFLSGSRVERRKGNHSESKNHCLSVLLGMPFACCSMCLPCLGRVQASVLKWSSLLSVSSSISFLSQGCRVVFDASLLLHSLKLSDCICGPQLDPAQLQRNPFQRKSIGILNKCVSNWMRDRH